MDDFDTYPVAESSQTATKRSSSGLTLVLPPLNAVKALKNKKKAKLTHDAGIKKIPRPVKLKPLKEVLSKLIAQIKKKDDYAFFLEPVNPDKVPGYSDLVKRPMDLGTMSTKVARNKYRSLEDFASDVRLVTTNAKIFNPPGTIYYTEADRIEAWALEHIAKAASSVIEYETEWMVEIENDDEPQQSPAADDGERDGTPMDVDDTRSVSTAPPQRRARGAASTKKTPGKLSESLEVDGHLPGWKDGLGQFPPGSEWAQTMLALKLKGKKYRSKKERMRIERSGPPMAPDGSIDYPEMEDPFSVLSILVPDPLARPQLTELYPTPIQPESTFAQPPFPTAVNIPTDRPVPLLTSLSPLPAATPSSSSRTKSKRRHWVVTRNPARGRGRDKDDDDLSLWKVQREVQTTDYGSYATLASRLAEENGVVDVGAALGSEEQLFDAIRRSVEKNADTRKTVEVKVKAEAEYWHKDISDAQDYVRDVVYGGVDGWAYVRSIAEFVSTPESMFDYNELPTYESLGMPLAEFVEQALIDPLTDGRHSLLRATVAHLISSAHPAPSASPTLLTQVERSLHLYPKIYAQLAELKRILSGPLDMATLIHQPDELFLAENEWAGAAYKAAKERTVENDAQAYLRFAIEEHRRGDGGAANGWEDSEVLKHALCVAADDIEKLHAQMTAVKQESVDAQDTAENEGKTDAESPLVRRLRMNLLALAKRAPLDTIARLRRELVPPNVQQFVPLLDE